MSELSAHESPSEWSPPTAKAPPPSAASAPVPLTGYGSNSYAGPATMMTDQRSPGGAVIAIAWVTTVLTLGYMLPWAIAATRGRANQAAIGLINFLLGWTVIGWIVALVMACQAHQIASHGAHTMMVVAHNPASQVAPPAGWYPAPSGHGQQYWNGSAWTDHRAP